MKETRIRVNQLKLVNGYGKKVGTRYMTSYERKIGGKWLKLELEYSDTLKQAQEIAAGLCDEYDMDCYEVLTA